MLDTDGYSHVLTSSTVFTTLVIGWAAFGLSLVFNILYYALHPSQVKFIFVNFDKIGLRQTISYIDLVTIVTLTDFDFLGKLVEYR